MSELTHKLQQLPTFQTLNEIETTLLSVDTPKKFNLEDPEQLAAQLERLRVREGLDREAAIAAFRLEVVHSTDSLLTLHERLAVTAAYDPAVRTRHEENDRAVSEQLDPHSEWGSHYRRMGIHNQMLVNASVYGIEGWGVPSPIRNAEMLANHIGAARLFAKEYARKKVAIRLSRSNTVTGTLPAPERSFTIAEPFTHNDGIEYHVPSSFSGIHDLTMYSENGQSKITSTTPNAFPQVLEVVENKVVANPQLSRLRQSLGLLGVNIHREFYLDDFEKDIIPESKGWSHIMPRRRIRRPYSPPEDDVVFR